MYQLDPKFYMKVPMHFDTNKISIQKVFRIRKRRLQKKKKTHFINILI